MNVLMHWLPQIVGSVILAIVGFVGLWKIERDERRAKQDQTDKSAGSPASR